jgi:hypothetical protein
MEADWEFEIGGGAPVIDAHWPGFVDLGKNPERARDFAEAQQLPGLADVLAYLNASNSRVWTCKTDVFDPGDVDPDELDAATDEATHALCCYIDLLPRGDGQWSSSPQVEGDCKRVCRGLSARSLRCCRVDLVIRLAHTISNSNDLGVTAYMTACGRNEINAKSRLTECVAIFAEVVAAVGLSSMGA